MIVGAAVCYGALKYHVVRTNQGYQLIPKVTAAFSDTYVDVRGFRIEDWKNHKSLVAALVQSGNGSLLGEAGANSLRDEAENLLDRLGLKPRSEKTE
jgi:hypothetical protein